MYQYVGWVTGIVYAEHEIKSEAHRVLMAQYPTSIKDITKKINGGFRQSNVSQIYPEPLFWRKIK